MYSILYMGKYKDFLNDFKYFIYMRDSLIIPGISKSL